MKGKNRTKYIYLALFVVITLIASGILVTRQMYRNPCDLGVPYERAAKLHIPMKYGINDLPAYDVLIQAVQLSDDEWLACYRMVPPGGTPDGEILSWIEFSFSPQVHLGGEVWGWRGDYGWSVLHRRGEGEGAWIVMPDGRMGRLVAPASEALDVIHARPMVMPESVPGILETSEILTVTSFSDFEWQGLFEFRGGDSGNTLYYYEVWKLAGYERLFATRLGWEVGFKCSLKESEAGITMLAVSDYIDLDTGQIIYALEPCGDWKDPYLAALDSLP